MRAEVFAERVSEGRKEGISSVPSHLGLMPTELAIAVSPFKQSQRVHEPLTLRKNAFAVQFTSDASKKRYEMSMSGNEWDSTRLQIAFNLH